MINKEHESLRKQFERNSLRFYASAIAVMIGVLAVVWYLKGR